MLESLHPNLMSFIAAVFVAVSQVMYRVALNRLSPAITTLMLNLISVTLAGGLYMLGEGVSAWPLTALFWFAMVGVFGSLVGKYLSLLGVNLIGLARNQVMVQSVLVWSSLQGVVFLGERMTAGIAAGTLAIMCGAILLVYDRRAGEVKAPLRYYLVPVFASFLFSLTFVFRRFGLIMLPSVPMGIAVSTGSATLLLAAVMPFSKEGGTGRWDPRGLFTVVLGTVANLIAAVFFWTAIQRGEVVQVIPINRLSLLLVIFLSWLFLQKQEVVTWRITLGGVLSVAGAYAVVWGR
ncbi:DMT family transporter [Nitrospinota bacterium]